tara:strand:- start:75 stop:329 length:255 start_codon:yes stop_codon:yes gene_type:complete
MSPKFTHLTQAQTIDVLRASLLNIGHLLPEGMEVFFFREGEDPRPRMQVVMPDGTDTEYCFTSQTPLELVPVVNALAEIPPEEV